MPAVSARSLSRADLPAFDNGGTNSGEDQRFLCPLEDCEGYPMDDYHRSLVANLSNGAWQCYRCDSTGKLVEYRTHGRGGLRQRSRSKVSSVPRMPLKPQHVSPEVSAELHRYLDEALSLGATPGGVYVEGRGIPLSLAEDSGLRYHRSWYGRSAVLVPIKDGKGELVGLSGRFIRDEKLRWQAMGSKSLGVFTTPDALASEVVTITEGAFDALALAACGVPALALMGTTWPSWLPVKLAFRRVMVALDNDEKGNETSAKLLALLQSLGAKAERLVPPEKDWGESFETDELKLRGLMINAGLVVSCPVFLSPALKS